MVPIIHNINTTNTYTEGESERERARQREESDERERKRERSYLDSARVEALEYQRKGLRKEKVKSESNFLLLKRLICQRPLR